MHRHHEAPEQAVGFGHRDAAEALADHAMGIELQLVELAEQVERARAQHRWDDARMLRVEEVRLEGELARTAEAISRRSS